MGAFLKESEFQAVVFGESAWSSALAPVLSEVLGIGLAAGVETLEVDSAGGGLLATASAYGGRLRRAFALTAPRPHLFVIAKAGEGTVDLVSQDVPVEDV